MPVYIPDSDIRGLFIRLGSWLLSVITENL